MIKTLLVTLFAAFFLIGGVPQAYAGCGDCKCASQSEKAGMPCEKEMGKDCKCGKNAKKPCEKKKGKKPCGKYKEEKHDANIRTGDEVRSNIGSLQMQSGIKKDSYND